MPLQPVVLMSSLLWTIAGFSSFAQTAVDSFSHDETERRLKSIYEKGEFRANEFAGKWWADGTGYSVRQQDPKSGRQVTVHFDAATGAETDRTPRDDQRRDVRSLISPDGKFRIDTRGGNLSVVNPESNERTVIAKRNTKRDAGFRSPVWSPDSRYIAFHETDETDVRERVMLVPKDPSYPGIRKRRFARVGGKIAGLRVAVADVEGNNLHWLPIDSPAEGFYLGRLEWAGDELLVERLSRFRDTREFFLTSVDGKMRRIYRETNDAWAIGSQEIALGATWIRDGKAFIVVSEKDGWRHAFLYSREGEELAVLTPGEYDIIDKSVVDEIGGWYYFYASPENGTEKYLYRVPLEGGEAERITPADQPGTHDYRLSPDAKFAFHTWSTFDSPPVVELVEIEGHRVVKVLEDNADLHERARTVITRPTDFLKLDIDNGVTMDAWLIKPHDFDQSKKYPVFVYVYGEPYAQTVLNKWGAGQSHFLRVIADLGYLVVSIDNRGTPCPKGAAWRRSIFGSLGPLSTKDQVAGLKELGRMLPYVDLTRVGIWGWSGGGSNTLNAMFRQPDDYHVGIAVVPKPQPHLYNAWFQEIYMRTREVNSEGYARSAPINFAGGLKGKLLIITGSGETNTHIQIIEGLVDKLIKLGKQFDYMVYPNRDHGLREGEGTTVHVRTLIARYLLEHLPAGPR